jgi:RNA polymerase sigma factor (sigma-70 family)
MAVEQLRPEEPGGACFAATHWTVVLAAAERDSERRARALETLCRAYWEPLYGYIRRSGCSFHDAQDLTQAFFAHLLDGQRLAGLSPAKGKFRSFLLASLKNFLVDAHDHATAAKRGGGREPLLLDFETAENRQAHDLAAASGTDHAFDRRWALIVLNSALARLRGEFGQAGKARQFEELSPFLSTEGTAEAYAAAAGRLTMTTGAVSVAVHRLRQRYRELIRAEIAHTVSGPSEVEEEMRYLLELLCR